MDLYSPAHTFSHTHSNLCVHTQTFHTRNQIFSVYTLVPAYTGTLCWTFLDAFTQKHRPTAQPPLRSTQEHATSVPGAPSQRSTPCLPAATSLLPGIIERSGRPLLSAHTPSNAHVSLRTHVHRLPPLLPLQLAARPSLRPRGCGWPIRARWMLSPRRAAQLFGCGGKGRGHGDAPHSPPWCLPP